MGYSSHWNADTVEVTKRISNEWSKLASSFPFPMVQLSPLQPVSNSGEDRSVVTLSIQGRGVFYALIQKNPHFPKQVPDSVVTTTDVHNALEQAARSLSDTIEVVEIGGVAIAGHLFKTPLAQLESVAMDIGETERACIMEITEELLALQKFASFLVRAQDTNYAARNAQEIRMKSDSTRDFFVFIQKLVDDGLKTRSSGQFSGNRAIHANDIQQEGGITVSKSDDSFSNRSVVYCSEQVKVTVHALLDNAMGGLPENPNHKKLRAELRRSNECLYLIVENTTAVMGVDLDEKVAKLQLGSIGYVGCTTLVLGCKVCKYEKPKWEGKCDFNYGTITATVQIATLKPERNA